MWSCLDNQEVGLEAATLESVRNRALVKCVCAENVAGLKYTAEVVAMIFLDCWVGERRVAVEAAV